MNLINEERDEERDAKRFIRLQCRLVIQQQRYCNLMHREVQKAYFEGIAEKLSKKNRDDDI